MSTATAEKATETESVKFFARSPNLVLVRIAEDIITDQRGKKIANYNRAAEVRRLKEENSRIVENGGTPADISYYDAPWKIEFERHEFETDDPVLIDFMREHPLLNNPISGFFEREKSPDELKPSVAEQQDRIDAALYEADTDELEAIIAGERETHNRDSVISRGEAALKRIRDHQGQAAPAGDDNDQTGPPDEPGSAHS
jgi:hypothetical protein